MYRLFIGLYLLVNLASCSSQDSSEIPPDIHLGEEACHECHMIINEIRYAASSISSNGETHIFDDIGDLILYLQKNQEEKAEWVHDYKSKEWIRAKQATFVFSKEFKTPMGSGIVAVKNLVQAQQLATKYKGKVLKIDQLPSIVNQFYIKQ